MRLRPKDLAGAARVAAVAALVLAPACKERRDSANLQSNEALTHTPSLGLDVKTLELGRGWKSTPAKPTEQRCVQESATALHFSDEATDDDPGTARWYESEEFRADPKRIVPQPMAAATTAESEPEPFPIDYVDPEPLFVPNEFTSIGKPAGSEPEVESEGPVGGASLALAGPVVTGLDKFTSSACAEPSTKAWRDKVVEAMGTDTPRTGIGGGKISFQRAASLVQLATALNLQATVAAEALGSGISNETKVKFALNFERESVYQVINVTIPSTDRQAIAKPVFTTFGQQALTGGFFDKCGDAFISQRTLGARYIQYYLTTRSSLEQSFSIENRTTVKLKLGPFKRSASVTVGWEFSESQQSQFLEEWRYVAAPSQPAEFPKTPGCMTLFAMTLHNALLVAPPGAGAPVSFQSEPYKGVVPGAELAVGRRLANGEAFARRYLEVVDELAKYLGSIRDALANPGEYDALADRTVLLAKFKEMSGTDFTAAAQLDGKKPGGQIAAIITEGRALLDQYERGDVFANTFDQKLLSWAKVMDEAILPKRFRFSYVVDSQMLTRNDALTICSDLRKQTHTMETLKLLKELFPQGVWRLPSLTEAKALKHAFGALLPDAPAGRHRIHVAGRPPGQLEQWWLSGDGDPETGLQVVPAPNDDGKAATVCVFGPVWPGY